MQLKVESNNQTVNHWCPKSGKQVQIDTNRSKTCVDCKFAIHRLTFVPPTFVQYVFLAHVVSLLFFVYYIFIQDLFLLYVAILVFIFDLWFFFYAKWKISQKHLDVQHAKIQELRNWALRKV